MKASRRTIVFALKGIIVCGDSGHKI